jgi:two-component system cell cycle sensor histidine kinase/response regulator CckA
MADQKKHGKRKRSTAGISASSTAKKSRTATSHSGKAKKKARNTNEKKSTVKKQRKGELALTETILKRIINSTESTMTIFSNDGTILFANKYATLNLSGDGSTDIAGKHVSEFIPEAQVEQLIYGCRHVIATGKPLEREVVITMRGEDRWFLNTLSPISLDAKGETVILSTSHEITGQKTAEAASKDSEKRLKALIDAIPDAVFFKDVSGRHIIVNSANEELFGLSPEMMTGKMVEDLLPPDIASMCRKDDIEVMKKRVTVHSEEHVIDKDGKEQILYTIKVPLFDDNGNAMGLVGIARDITERKLAEERITESEDRFRSIFEHAIDGIMIADTLRKRNVEANRSICTMLGYTRNALLSLPVEEMHPKADLPRILDLFEQQARGETSLAPDIPMLRKDGSTLYVDVNAARVTLGGKPYLVGIFRDITERKQAEEALRKREHQLAESQRIAHIGSWEHNLKTGQVFWSDELFRLLGLDPDKDPGDFQMFFDMIHFDDQPMLKAAIEKTLRDKTPFSVNYRFTFRDGTSGIIYARAELIEDDEGDPVILSGTAQDITEQKLAENKIRQSEEFIRSILNTVDEGFIVIDRDYRIVIANSAYCEQVGMASDEVIGQHCFEISHKKTIPCFEVGEECAVKLAFETGKPHTALHRHSDNGHSIFVETKAYPLKEEAGTVTSVIETINNITEKHLLEEERLKTQKLESIGLLAGGIAHDFNNLLQGIFGYIAIARMAIDDKERSLSAIDQAEKALQQSVNLTNQLLTFSKGGEPVMKNTDPGPVIENATAFAMSGSGSKYNINLDKELWSILADQGQIAQVIQNIVLNADQAMRASGTIEVSARNIRAGDPTFPTTLPPGDYVAIQIRDSGVGIPKQHHDKVFDPYFSTKENGSGLGLATSYSIINKHHGTITLSSRPEMGTTFTIYLPAAKVMTEGLAPTACVEIKKTARILVMDDEEIIREVMGHLLNALDFDVVLAHNGEDTLAQYRKAIESDRPFDVVIMDLTIRGGMGGVETVGKLLEIDPDAKAVVSSGYSDDADLAEYRKHGFKAFLKKPYNVEELKSVLHSLL